MRAPILITLAATLAAGGCALRPKPPLEHMIAGPGGVQYPFAVASIVIHPLTRVNRDSKGKLWIICHLEFRDAWGDTTKGIGSLKIQLYRPTGGRAAGLGTQEASWDVNLSDLDTNASLYDPATRTYRLPLEGAPAWVGESAGGDKDLPVIRLRAILTTTGPQGAALTLEDEFGIGG